MNLKKISLFIVAIVTLFACNNEEVVNPQIQGLQVNADFLRLSDNNGITAGNLVINADVPEVTIKWNTGSLCNLDTTQTTLELSKGRAILPIKWMGKLESGTYGPEGVAFKAGVQIIAGKECRYVPLVWAEKIDSTEILKSAIQTRAAGDIMPRVAQISMIPLTVNMNEVNGGAMYIGLTDVAFAVLDVSEFTSNLNIDMTKIPNYLLASQMLEFKWTAAGAPNFGFSVNIIAQADGITQFGTIVYTRSTPPVPEEYKVTYDANNNTGAQINDANHKADDLITVKSNTFTSPAGKVFYAWNTQANGSGTIYGPGDSFNIKNDVTLYAMWKSKPVYTATYYYWDAPLNQSYFSVYPYENMNKTYVANRSCASCFSRAKWTTIMGYGHLWTYEMEVYDNRIFNITNGRAGAWININTAIPNYSQVSRRLTTWLKNPSVISSLNDPVAWLVANCVFLPANDSASFGVVQGGHQCVNVWTNESTSQYSGGYTYWFPYGMEIVPSEMRFFTSTGIVAGYPEVNKSGVACEIFP